MHSLKDEHIVTLVGRCSKLKVLDLRNTEITNISLTSIMNHLKNTLEELDVMCTEIKCDKLLGLKNLPKFTTLTCNDKDYHVLKRNLSFLSINEDIFWQMIAVPNDFYQYSIWEIEAEETDLFDENEHWIWYGDTSRVILD